MTAIQAGGRGAWPWRRRIALTLVFALAALALFASWRISRIDAIDVGPNDYNLAAWEYRNVPRKWLYEFGELFRDNPSVEEQDTAIRRFFELTRGIDRLEGQISGAAQRGEDGGEAGITELAALRKERDGLQGQVEDTLEQRLTHTLDRLGITRDLPLLGETVWPPVDFAFTDPPYSLAVSPRERIQLESTRLLRAGLTLSEIERIEAAKERRDDVSALAFPTGGVGAYPALVAYADSYADAAGIAAHEWTHNYLSFRPLGLNYYKNAQLRAMNETVADLVGNEVAAALLERWPMEEARPAPRGRPSVDLGNFLRQVRAEAVELLAAGRTEEAEALMEQRRQELEAMGVRIRKLNQAYFAFTNLYAGQSGSPGATNPIGPKIDELRRRSGSLDRFVELAGTLTSVDALDQALASLNGEPASPAP